MPSHWALLPPLFEKQVMVVFAATKGYLDNVAIEDVRRYEEDLYRFLEARHPGVLSGIATKKTLDDDLTNRLKAAIGAFKPLFVAD